MKWGHKSVFGHAGVMEMHGVDDMVITVYLYGNALE